MAGGGVHCRKPAFLGGKLMRTGLGDDYIETLFRTYKDRVPQEADLVLYWFEKARGALSLNRSKRIGFVGTNSIRGGANRRVVEAILRDARIFSAWSDEAWVVDGAAVRVSLLCFSKDTDPAQLDGAVVWRWRWPADRRRSPPPGCLASGLWGRERFRRWWWGYSEDHCRHRAKYRGAATKKFVETRIQDTECRIIDTSDSNCCTVWNNTRIKPDKKPIFDTRGVRIYWLIPRNFLRSD